MINKYAEINERVLLYNAMKGILRVKLAGRSFDPAAAGLNAEQEAAYANYKPLAPGDYSDLALRHNVGSGTVTALPGAHNDLKGRNIRIHNFDNNSAINKFTGWGDKAKLLRHTNVDVSPAENLLAGRSATARIGRIDSELLNKGYSADEIAGLRGAESIYGLTDRDIANDKKVGPLWGVKTNDLINKSKSGTLYIDENGNILDRSKGIQRGRKIGAGVGAAGGAALGGLAGYGASRGLGLYGENSTTAKRMLGHLLTAGGAVAGGVGGYYGGRSLGAGIGGWIDPQKGNAIKVYANK